jgi:hypothetical protein
MPNDRADRLTVATQILVAFMRDDHYPSTANIKEAVRIADLLIEACNGN